MAKVCPETEAICPHARFGCSWKGKRRLLRHDHLDVDCIFEPLKGVLNVHEQRIECLERENSNLKRDLAELRNTFEDLEHRVERITNDIGYVQTRNDNSQPINQQLDNLIARVNDLNRTSTRSQLASEHTLHEVKGEMSNLHMMIHDLRGEFMALQHAQYYENAYRQWGRGYGPLSSRPADQSGSSKSSDEGDLAANGASHEATGLRNMATSQPGLPAIGYPFPPYGTMQPGPGGFVGATNAPYGMVPPAPLFGPRRWSGWPYSLGSSSPEERGGGVKL